MAQVPAICDSCGLIFTTTSVIGGDAAGVTFIGCSIECPRCGAMARIPDGAYNFIGKSIELLRGSNSSIEQVRKLQALLQNAQQRQEDPEKLSQVIQQELPQFSSLSDILPKNRTDLYAFITILLTIVGMILAAWKDNKEPPKIEINQVTNVFNQQPVLADTQQSKKQRIAPSANAKPKKIGRNDPCYCGRRIKYKKCHGR